MKNLSKVLAVVLAFAMALSMVSFAAYTDVKAGDNCEEAVTVLSALEILKGYEDGSFKPEATITRAEFATVVIRLLGLADSASATATMFNDVAADHWASGAIALASQQGIVNGYGDGNFGPEDPVKYNEAIKMIVAALGYTPMADANGGWPGGFQVVASQKGILAGISGIGATAEAPRGVVAQLAYNALTVPLMEQTGFGTQTNFATVGALLLNKIGVTKFEGVVEGTSLSSNLKAGEINVRYNYQITGVQGMATAKKYDPSDATQKMYCNPVVSSATPKLYANGAVEEAAKDLIDVASVMYVKNADSDKAELVCIMKDGSKNETVEFMTEDLKVDFAAAGSTNTIEVYTDADAGETEEYLLNIRKVYVNGRTKSVEAACGVAAGNDLTASNFNTVLSYYIDDEKHVDVKLLSQEDDEFNVAYITTYKDVQVTRVAAKTWKVSYNNLGVAGASSVILDETSKTQRFEIYKDGEIASFEDIKEDDVLSIAGYINADKELVYGKVYIVSDKVEGKVTAKSSDKVAVDGEIYKTTLTSGFSLGDTAVFFKNYRGILVAVDTTATAANVKYGFATYARAYDADYGDPACIRLLNAEGKWETIALADTVSIDGGSRIKSKDINWTTYTAGNGTALALVTGSTTKYGINEVIAYDLNASGYISKIFLNNTTEIFEEVTVNSGRYDADTYMIQDTFLDEDTVIFSVPAGVQGVRTNDTDESDVYLVALGSLADSQVYTLLAGYDEDESGIVGAIIGQGMTAGVEYDSNFFVVSDVMEATNEAGEAGIILTGIEAGEKATLFINTDEPEAEIKKAVYTSASATVEAQLVNASTFAFEIGDVLLYTLDSKGEAAVINILAEGSDIAKNLNAGSYTSLNTIDTIADGRTLLAEITGNTTYKFVVGYAKEILKNGNLSLFAEDNTSVDTYAFAADVIGTYVDCYTGDGKVIDAMSGDITCDSNAGIGGLANDGDIVFARVVGSRVAEFVTFRNSK